MTKNLLFKKLLFLFLLISCSVSAQWTEVGGTNNSTFSSNINTIYRDTMGILYVGGDFRNGLNRAYVSKYDGSAWKEVGGTNTAFFGTGLWSISGWDSNNIFAVGYSKYIYNWNSVKWDTMGVRLKDYNKGITLDKPTATLYRYGNPPLGFARDTNAIGKYYLSKWNGTVWLEIGGANTSTFNGPLQSIAVRPNGNIYAGGFFTNTNGFNYVALWNGTTWSEVGGNNNTTFFNDIINKIKVAPNGDIYALGPFTNLNGFQFLAKWNGTAWSEVGGANNTNFDIYDVAIDSKGNVYIGGNFQNGNLKKYIAKWNGTAWIELGGTNTSTFNGNISTLMIDDFNNLYITGFFTNGNGKNYVAKYALCTTTTSNNNKSVCAKLLPYTWGNKTFAMGGTKIDTLINAGGCDSFATLNLSVKDTSGSVNANAVCAKQLPYTWGSKVFNTAGIKKDTLLNAAGCDSFVVYDLKVKSSTDSITNIAICQSAFPYIWHSKVFPVNGIYYDTLVNAAGCDSFCTLNLGLIGTKFTNITVTACNSYTWFGTTYTTGGQKNHVATGYLGCDSVILLNLTLTNSVTSIDSISSCGAFMWNGTNYTNSGTYKFTITNPNGCDSVASIVLKINDTKLVPEFLVASQLFKNEVAEIINITVQKYDSAIWIYPKHDSIKTINKFPGLLELQFADTGFFKIGLRTKLGNCFNETYRTVHVIEGKVFDKPNFIRDPFIKKFEMTPNPTSGNFNVAVKLSDTSVIRLRIYNLANNVFMHEKQEFGSKEYNIPYSLTLPNGIYIMILETPKGNLILKFIKQ